MSLMVMRSCCNLKTKESAMECIGEMDLIVRKGVAKQVISLSDID